MASAASASAHAASSAAIVASSCRLRCSTLAFTSSILALASAFICAHLLCALSSAASIFLLGVLLCEIHIDLGLVDAGLELLTRLRGGGLHRRQRIGRALFHGCELCGEVHAYSSTGWIPTSQPPLG